VRCHERHRVAEAAHRAARKETQAATIVVIIGVVIVGLYLGLVDFLLSVIIRRALS